jgi:transcriptional regulator of acetoin/glycerol metabolism
MTAEELILNVLRRVDFNQERINLPLLVQNMEKLLIRKSLEFTEWRTLRAANLLGIQRTTMHEKAKKLGVKKPPELIDW